MTIIGMFAFEHVIISSFDFTDIFFSYSFIAALDFLE